MAIREKRKVKGGGGGGGSLEDLTDVLITQPAVEGQGIWFDEETQSWRNRGTISEAFPTGLILGGELNIGPGPNDIEVLAGAGLLVDSYSDPLAPAKAVAVTWEQINEPITAAPSVAGSIIFVSIAATAVPSPDPDIGGIPSFVGVLKQYFSPPAPQLAREELFLGAAVHNGNEWREVSNPKVVNQTAETLREFVTTVSGLSRIIAGGNITEQAGFELNQAEATIWENNRNWHNNRADPNRELLPASEPIVFEYVNRDFSDVGGATSEVDPTQWDDNGTVGNVPGNNNQATIQRLYLDAANNYWMLWGQTRYPNFTVAFANLQAYSPTVPFLLENSIFLGSVVAEKGKKDWDNNEAVFLPRTGAGGSSTAGVPVTTFAGLSDTPASYTGQKTAVPQVDVAELGLEYDYRTKYVTPYVEGATYYPQNMVNNAAWIAIANTETVEPAFPVEVGQRLRIYPDVPPFLESSHVGQVRSGHLSTFTQNGDITTAEVWIPEVTVDTHFTLVTVLDPNGAPQLTRRELANASLTPGQWNTIALGGLVVTVGTEVLAYLESQNYGGSTVVTGGWRYDGTSNNAGPTASGWNTNNAQTFLRIDTQDLDTTDRKTELLGIVTGSTILFAETANPANAQTYLTIGAPVDQTLYIEYPVSLTSETGKIDPGDVSTMTADVPVPQASKFVYELDKFATQPTFANIVSFLEYDDVPQSVPATIGYGINYNFQQLSQSADWNLIALGDGGGSGGGDFTPTLFTGAGSSGYVPDPVTETGKVLKDNGAWGLLDTNPDGGFANSVYTAPQLIDGGSA